MPQRVRSRSQSVSAGSTWNTSDPAGTLTHGSYTPAEEFITDSIGKLKRPDGSISPSELEKTDYIRQPFFLNKSSGNSWRFQGRLCYESYLPGTEGYLPRSNSTRLAQNTQYAAQLIAATHPFRSEFSVPIAIKEMVDLSTLFKISTESFAQYVGSSYLAYRFGWVSFVRDIKVLHGITKALESRIRELNSLSMKGGLRRKVDLDEWAQRGKTLDITIHSAYSTIIKADREYHRSIKTWGSIRWKLHDHVVLPTDSLERFNLAVQTIFDLGELDGPTAWGVIPWSWLIDYFVNLGDVLQSNHMMAFLEPYDLCIMRDYRHKTKHTITEIPASSKATGYGYYERRIRCRDLPLIPIGWEAFKFELITESQTKVLLALLLSLSGKLK
jgi:hypothetical protein